VRSLTYPVEARSVLKYLGQLCAATGILSVAPALLAVAVGEVRLILPALLPAVMLTVPGLFLARIAAPPELRANDALVIPALTFVIAPIALCVPMILQGIPPVDAFFEAVSGLTTTGLSTLRTLEDMPRTFLFARAFIQWVGGLGIVVLALALFIGPGGVARRLAPDYMDGAEIVASTRAHARHVLTVYLTLTAVGIGLLWIEGLPLFDAVVHALAAVSTGGFAPHDTSLAALPGWAAPVTITLVGMAGAISFGLYYGSTRGRLRKILVDLEVRTLIFAILAVTVALFAFAAIAGRLTPGLALDLPLMAISAQTTTGFAVMSPHDLDPASKIVRIISMAIGGDVGSTAGGIKIVRVLILFRVLQGFLLRKLMPSHAVLDLRVGRNKMQPVDVEGAITIFLLFLLVILVSWLPFLAFGYNPIDGLFEVVSAVGTVGLSSGITRPELEPFLKGVLCFDMWMGRLEIVALLLVLYPRTWIRAGGRGS
jgi:trk system potassium uptake protein TrkH